MYYFCTYFDHRYLPRGLALYQSLKRHCPSFQLWVLCMDQPCYDVLSQLSLPGVHPIMLEDFEREDGELLAAKQNRTPIEYYFTCTPSLPLFILNSYAEVDLVTYLDADSFFFADPAAIYDEIGDRSIAIIEHRFPPHLRDREQYGIYNVGWLSFRRDEHALACLHWWRERCIEWCYDRCENGRFADQKYLDDWPVRFQRVVVLQHKGAGLAPWNWMNYHISIWDESPTVDGQPLIFYHFHRLKTLNWWLSDLGLDYGTMPSTLRRRLYAPYVRSLKGAWQCVRRAMPQIDPKFGNPRTVPYSFRTLIKRALQGQILVTIGPLTF
jgi:hypothetical protein